MNLVIDSLNCYGFLHNRLRTYLLTLHLDPFFASTANKTKVSVNETKSYFSLIVVHFLITELLNRNPWNSGTVTVSASATSGDNQYLYVHLKCQLGHKSLKWHMPLWRKICHSKNNSMQIFGIVTECDFRKKIHSTETKKNWCDDLDFRWRSRVSDFFRIHG